MAVPKVSDMPAPSHRGAAVQTAPPATSEAATPPANGQAKTKRAGDPELKAINGVFRLLNNVPTVAGRIRVTQYVASKLAEQRGEPAAA